ncbi:MAG: PIN domain-containing protein [Gemmatimonadota bacterium]
MTWLLDVNVLVALFDPEHVHHEAAHRWFAGARSAGWATCPLTENGLVRVVSNPAYPGRRTTVADAVSRLRQFTDSGNHVHWPDDVSLLRPDELDGSQLTGHREITDAYLLALAVRHDGALATFDRSVRTAAVPAFEPRHLVAIQP